MKTLIHILTRSLCLSLVFIAISNVKLSAQQLYKIGPQTQMTISGTSTLHDWTSTVEAISGEGIFTLEGGSIKQVADLNLRIEVKSIKSGKGAIMDNNTYKALKASHYPYITYELLSLQTLPNGKLNTTGQLVIGGVSKKVRMEVNYQLEAGKVSIQGKLPILLRDYQIDPPTAMMGTITTGEEVTVAFHAVFTVAKQLSAN